nr:hypothetical protein [Actinomycetales bacterium]
MEVWPAVLREGDAANVRVRVTNRSEERIEGATVELAAQGWTPNTRFTLHRWLDPDAYIAAVDLAELSVPTLGPGATAEVRFEVPAADFRFDTWGPRGIQVESVVPETTETDDGATATPSAPTPEIPGAGEPAPSTAALPDRDRSWVTWWNEPEITPVPVGVLVPITPTTTELASAAGWEDRYSRLLSQGTAPGVTLLVDPAPLSLPSTSPATRDSVQPLLGTAAEVWSLPWAWADTAALQAAERPDLIAGAAIRSADELAQLGAPSTNPIEGTIDPSRAVADADPSPLLISADSVPGWYATGTPGAAVMVGGRPAVVLDTLLGEVLAGTAVVADTTHLLTASQQRQLTAATTAVTVREDPDLARPVLVSLSPDDDGAPNHVTTVLPELPWVTPVTLSEAVALTSTAPDVGVQVLDSAEDPSGGAVTAGQLGEAADVEGRFEVVASVVENPAAITTPELAQLDLLAARAWRADPAERDRRLAVASDAVADLRGKLSVITPANVLMVSESSNFPLTVSNELATDATVLVSLTATDLRLQQVEPQLVTVPAGSEVRGDIPVTAVGSGDLTVEILLSTPDGQPLGDGLPVEVRMRAEWENTAMLGLIGLGVVSFGFGIFRTVRRNVREDRSAVLEEAREQYEVHLAELEEARMARWSAGPRGGPGE